MREVAGAGFAAPGVLGASCGVTLSIMADDAFYVTTEVGGRTIQFRHRIPDPLVSQRVTIGWPDLLRGLWRRKLVVTVTVGGDADVVEGVMAVAGHAGDAVAG